MTAASVQDSTAGLTDPQATDVQKERDLLRVVQDAEELQNGIVDHVRSFLRDDVDPSVMLPLQEVLCQEKEHWIIALSTFSDERREEHMRMVHAARSAREALFIFCKIHAKHPVEWEREEERIRQTFERSREAAGELIAMHLQYIHHLAHSRRRYSEVAYDDLVVQGMIGLLRAIREFDPAQSNRLLTHATWRIRSAMGSWEEKQLRHRLQRVHLEQSEETNDHWGAIPGREPGPLEQLIAKEEEEERERRQRLVRDHVAMLNPLQRDAVHAVNGFDGGPGMSNGEYGRRRGTGRESVRLLLVRAQKLLRQSLGDIVESSAD